MATAGNNKLSDSEKELLKFTKEQNYDEVKRLMTIEKLNVNCCDEDGNTPLQHAAYKGNYKLCKLLLDCGAHVNLTTSNTGYSALTFAGLSGNAEVVTLLLENGASVSCVNTIGKTAAQMAAFVGNHHVVSVINNFLPIKEIEYFTKVHGLEKEPKLPASLVNPVHKLVVMTNIHPVRLGLYFQANPIILENAKKVERVLNLLSEKMYKSDCNELLSLKYHHLAFVLENCAKYCDEVISRGGEALARLGKFNLTSRIKHWLSNDTKGFPLALENFLRRDVREYPYVECSLFQQLVRTLAGTEIGEEPSAISIIIEAVTGQRGLDSNSSCSACSDPKAEKKCSACKSVQYCDKMCQKLHWFTHKNYCIDLKKAYEESQKKESADMEINAVSKNMEDDLVLNGPPVAKPGTDSEDIEKDSTKDTSVTEVDTDSRNIEKDSTEDTSRVMEVGIDSQTIEEDSDVGTLAEKN